MENSIAIREYAEISRGRENFQHSLDSATICSSAFQWLAQKTEDPLWSGILRFKNPNTIKVRQYVGYLRTPCGLGIEILPKHSHLDNNYPIEQQLSNTRQLLQDMLSKSMLLNAKSVNVANLQTRNIPLHEWIFQQFLMELKTLILRGVRKDYEQIQEESKFIHGRLNFAKQALNVSVGKATHFYIEHDIYTPNRLENRLLATALHIVLRISGETSNIKLAHELNIYFSEIPAEPAPQKTWGKWQKKSLLSHYETIKQWCALILFGQNPDFIKGGQQGHSLLFDMNKLFESYVAHCLSDCYQVKPQPRERKLLLDQSNKHFFELRPDLKLNDDIIADCKWKLVNQNQLAEHNHSAFDVSSSDLYQICIYGFYHLEQKGKLILFYPEHHKFNKPIYFKLDAPPFLQLMIIPFPLEWNKKNQATLEAWLKSDGSVY